MFCSHKSLLCFEFKSYSRKCLDTHFDPFQRLNKIGKLIVKAVSWFWFFFLTDFFFLLLRTFFLPVIFLLPH